MNTKTKFSKLRLPASKRTNATTSQISAFFSKSQSPNNASTDDAANSEYPSTSTAAVTNGPPPTTTPTPPKTTPESVKSFEAVAQAFVSAIPKKLRRLDSEQPHTSTTIKSFFDKTGNESDFETSRKVVKKPAAIDLPAKKRQAKKSAKQQPKIKTALLKREQLMSDFIVQQSLMENVDPNEIQMALALSRSEIEVCKVDCETDDSNGSSNTMDCIRNKLEEFSYRPNCKSKYPFYATRKIRGARWANKFTPLTMRNVERQQEKVNKKIEEFLNSQCRKACSHMDVEQQSISIVSRLLCNMKARTGICLRHGRSEDYNLIDFYVMPGAFEPNTNKTGCLLKDFRRIPGRDLSPVKVVSNENDCPVEDWEEKTCSVVTGLETNAKRASCSYDDQDEEVLREGSPDLFFDEEKTEDIAGSYEEMKCTPKPSNVANQEQIEGRIEEVECEATKTKVDLGVVIVSSDSNNTNDIVTLERFSSDEVKSSERSSIWNQDLNYTLKSLSNANSLKVMDDVVNLTEDVNFFDLTQAENDLETHSDKSPSKSLDKPNYLQMNENENFTQNSSDSVIVLSDDEVNYSINMARNLKAVESPSDKVANSPVKYDHELPGDEFKDDAEFRFNNNYGCNEISLLHNIEDENVSLAHEIMQHSFRDELDKLPSTQCDDVDQVSTEDMPSIDLTQHSPQSRSSSPPQTAASTSQSAVSPPQRISPPHYRKSRENPDYECPSKLPRIMSDPISPKIDYFRAFKRFSSEKKFEKFPKDRNSRGNECAAEFDEFDRLVYGNVQKSPPKTAEQPEGLDRLLKGDIKASCSAGSSEEMLIDGRTYLVKIKGIMPKPAYDQMDSTKLLRELYKYGLKPLKRKQALIMLEYIYNQTHPYIVNDDGDNDVAEEKLANEQVANRSSNSDSETEIGAVTNSTKFGLKDSGASCLLVEDGLEPELENEKYIFQTNIRTKISTALLPLHLAWFNLLKSNHKLREAILYYEPIDLKEIYVFLKSIGYRYDPKNLKTFFDNRSIIFQYDLKKEGANRHVLHKGKTKKGMVK